MNIKSGRTVEWHLITSEYPPQIGGVSDYTFGVANGLAECGDDVHVWCPTGPPVETKRERVTVHRALGSISPSDLRAAARQLDAFPARRRILVQWVPHGYKYRSMNIGFCWWIWWRSVGRRDSVTLMVHEPYLQFKLKSLRQAGVALVHRLMTILLLQASNSVYVSIPEWEARWRPYALGRKVRFEWLPIPSNIEVASDSEAVQAIRRRYAPADNLLLGHFSSFGSLVCSLLEPILSRLVANGTDHPILLIGKGSNEFREQFVQREPAAAKCLHATGTLSLPEISAHLAASDVLIQPYPDGVSTRRTSFMAGLSHGKPIVTTAGELTEPFWLRTDCVGLAPAADLNSFVDLAQRLCRVEAERIRMGNAARLFYLERFEMSHTITRLRGMAAGENLTCAS